MIEVIVVIICSSAIKMVLIVIVTVVIESVPIVLTVLSIIIAPKSSNILTGPPASCAALPVSKERLEAPAAHLPSPEPPSCSSAFLELQLPIPANTGCLILLRSPRREDIPADLLDAARSAGFFLPSLSLKPLLSSILPPFPSKCFSTFPSLIYLSPSLFPPSDPQARWPPQRPSLLLLLRAPPPPRRVPLTCIPAEGAGLGGGRFLGPGSLQEHRAGAESESRSLLGVRGRGKARKDTQPQREL